MINLLIEFVTNLLTWVIVGATITFASFGFVVFVTMILEAEKESGWLE